MTVEYKSNLRNIASQIEAELNLALKETADDIADLAQQLAPEDTGALKASKDVRPDRGGWIVSFGRGLPDIRAIVQEYGSDNQPAQPYLTPAVAAIDPTLRAKARINALISRNRI
jgi:HK97 gp10 family phage protein